MRKIVWVLLLYSGFLKAQNHSANWLFGYQAGLTFTTFPPSVINGNTIGSNEGGSSYSDSNGNLLFYSNGERVNNRLYLIMLNGSGLGGSPYSSQSASILPSPGSSNLYYIITTPYYFQGGPLTFSIVDMNLDGGRGGVTTKNDTLLQSSSEKLTVLRHSNGTDYWIVAHGDSNDFYSFLCTSSGINRVPIVSYEGRAITKPIQKKGALKVSVCGDKIAMSNFNISDTTWLELFDFDNTSGLVSNAIELDARIPHDYGFRGVEFSPDGSKLYASVSGPGLILQFDLLAGSSTDIIASVDTVASISNSLIGALQLGPDNKIYLAINGDDALDCILDPDQPGVLCNYRQDYISIWPHSSTFGLPGSLSPLNCISSSVNDESEKSKMINVFPNPVHDKMRISFSKQKIESLSVEIYDVLGNKIYCKKENNISGLSIETIDMEDLPNQLYFLNINVDGEYIFKKIIKE